MQRQAWERIRWADHLRDEHLSHGRVRLAELGAGPPLLLLHGLGGNWQSWLANLPALSLHHRVIAVDLPGFGESEAFSGSVTMERYADSVVDLLDRLGIDRATFVGNSMGGLITIEAAVRHPERIAGAILACSGGIPLTDRRHRLVLLPLFRAINRLLRPSMVRRWALDHSWTRHALASGVVHRPRQVPPGLLSEALSGLGAPGCVPVLEAGLGYDARPRAPHVSCPTLVLWGREDRLLPLRMGRELHGLIPGSRLVVWDATGHCPMLEAPARFDELVATFVAGLARENRPQVGTAHPSSGRQPER